MELFFFVCCEARSEFLPSFQEISQMPGFDAEPVHVTLGVVRYVLGQFFSESFRFPVSTIAATFHTRLDLITVLIRSTSGVSLGTFQQSSCTVVHPAVSS